MASRSLPSGLDAARRSSGLDAEPSAAWPTFSFLDLAREMQAMPTALLERRLSQPRKDAA